MLIKSLSPQAVCALIIHFHVLACTSLFMTIKTISPVFLFTAPHQLVAVRYTG